MLRPKNQIGGNNRKAPGNVFAFVFRVEAGSRKSKLGEVIKLVHTWCVVARIFGARYLWTGAYFGLFSIRIFEEKMRALDSRWPTSCTLTQPGANKTGRIASHSLGHFNIETSGSWDFITPFKSFVTCQWMSGWRHNCYFSATRKLVDAPSVCFRKVERVGNKSKGFFGYFLIQFFCSVFLMFLVSHFRLVN